MEKPSLKTLAALVILHSFVALAQSSGGVIPSNLLSRISPPFPLPVNISTTFKFTASSIAPIGSGSSVLSETAITDTILTTGVVGSQINTTSSSASSLRVLPPSLASIPTDTTVVVSTQSRNFLLPSDVQTAGTVSNTDSPPPHSEHPVGSSASTGGIFQPAITPPPHPSTTLLPLGSSIGSSASDLSSIAAGIFPLLQRWINHPDVSEVTAVTSEIGKVLPKAFDLLAKLPKPLDEIEPCQHKHHRRSESLHTVIYSPNRRDLFGNLFKTAFSLVSCVIETTNNVKTTLIEGTADVVEVIKELQRNLEPMVAALKDIDSIDNSKSSAVNTDKPSPPSKSIASSSCSVRTVSDCKIHCMALATTTVGGAIKRAAEDPCTTVCGAPLTRCDETGLTSLSTTTSTATVFQRCSPGCLGCNANNRVLPTNAPNLSAYLKASNNVLYVPAVTIASYGDDSPASKTGKPDNVEKRALTNPHDSGRYDFNGTYIAQNE
jgi:hypothetical protein